MFLASFSIINSLFNSQNPDYVALGKESKKRTLELETETVLDSHVSKKVIKK